MFVSSTNINKCKRIVWSSWSLNKSTCRVAWQARVQRVEPGNNVIKEKFPSNNGGSREPHEHKAMLLNIFMIIMEIYQSSSCDVSTSFQPSWARLISASHTFSSLECVAHSAVGSCVHIQSRTASEQCELARCSACDRHTRVLDSERKKDDENSPQKM